MKVKLIVFTLDNIDDYALGRRFRFAVVNDDKSKNYPANFVCLLPSIIYEMGKSNNAFLKIFGNKSLEQAKLLLTAALKTEDKPEIRAEIERRLKLLEPKTGTHIKCGDCGNVFETKRVRKYSKNLCQACIIKKYGSRQ
jgi:hypothetical protein